jgi:DNA-binding beta-propeller fold protein YncE
VNKLLLVLAVLAIAIAGVLAFLLLSRPGTPEPLLTLVDYTSEDRLDGIAVVDLNPRSRTFGRILQEMPIDAGTAPHHLYYNRDGSRLYTTALGEKTLYRVEMNGDRISDIVSLDAAPCMVGEDLYFTQDGTKFYLTCMGSDRILVFDARTDQRLSQIEAPPSNEPHMLNPHGIGADETIDRLIVTNTIAPQTNQARSSVNVLELSTGRVLSTQELAKAPDQPSAPVEVTFLPDHPIAFITGMLEGTLWVAVWDDSSKSFEFRIVDDGTERGQGWPLEITLGPDGNLYVSFAQPGVVNVYSLTNPEQPQLIRTLPAEAGAHHIIFSPDGQYMFVQNNLLGLEGMNTGTISVVDLSTGRLVATVESFRKKGLLPTSLVLIGEPSH